MKQVKIYAEPELADAFKSLCIKNKTSVTAELSEYMRKRTHLTAPVAVTGHSMERRWQRKAATQRIVLLLEKIRDAESAYLDRIPENLQNGPMAEAASEAIKRLDAAIDELTDAYTA
jgi:hypothetical protein